MRSMHSTSRVTCSRMTSATVRGRLMVGSGHPRSLGDHHRIAVQQGLLSQTPSLARPEPFVLTGAAACLVGLRRSLASVRRSLPYRTQPASDSYLYVRLGI